MRRLQKITLTCALALGASQAIAGGFAERPQEVPFAKIDQNRNCYIDPQEFNAAFRTPGDAFVRMDHDADGRISREEARETYAAYRERHGMNVPDASQMRVEIPKEETRSFWSFFRFERGCTDWEKIKERRERFDRMRDDRSDDRDRPFIEPEPEEPAPQPEPEDPTPEPEPENPNPSPETDPENPGPDPESPQPEEPGPEVDQEPEGPDPRDPGYDGPPM